jgi:hypothetical protein
MLVRHPFQSTTAHKRRWLIAWYLLSVPSLAVAKDPFTTCQDVCDTLTSTTCTINSVHDVVAGSDVDCTTSRDITVTGGELRVHDGAFILRGKSLTLTNGGEIVADCPQAFVPIGYELVVADHLTMVANSQAKLSARCGVSGGRVAITTNGTVAIAALGIDVNGTAADAPGGDVRIAGGGAVTIGAEVSADATQGLAPGGTISVHGAIVEVLAELHAKGFGSASLERPGGAIRLDARDSVTISAGGGLNVGSAQGSGGSITISAAMLADIQRPIRAWGTGGATGTGGVVEIAADEVKIASDVTVTGGRRGGAIEIQAGAAGIQIGVSGQGTLDATGGAGESGGVVRIASREGHVLLGSSAIVRVNGGSGAEGGHLAVESTDVTTSTGTHIEVNGAAPDRGGSIDITARGTMTLAGTMEANNQGSKTFIYTTVVPSVSSSISGYQLVEMPYL